MTAGSGLPTVDAVGLKVGDELPPFIVDSVDPQRMKTMAALLDDPNPIHFDKDLVVRLGYGEAPVNQGPTTMAYMTNVLVGAFGARAIRRFQCRFLGNVFAGERIECRGTVTAIDTATSTVELALTASVADRQVLAGTASVSVEG